MSHDSTLPSIAPSHRRRILLLAIWGLMFCFSGCNSFGNARLVKELQSENERLLAEFRAQRDRTEELEKSNRLQAERLAESEKLLARMTQGSGAGRLSSIPPSMSQPPSFGGGANLGGAPNPPSFSTGLPGDAASAPATDGLRWHPRVGPAR